MLQQEPVTTFIGQEAEPEGRAAEACVGRRDPEVARERDRQPHLDRHAVDGRDGDLVEVQDRPDQLLRVRPEQRILIDLRVPDVAHLLGNQRRDMAVVLRRIEDVVTRAEPSTGTGDHDDARVDVELRLGHDLGEIALHAPADPVETVGLVERDHRDPGIVRRDVESPGRRRRASSVRVVWREARTSSPCPPRYAGTRRRVALPPATSGAPDRPSRDGHGERRDRAPPHRLAFAGMPPRVPRSASRVGRRPRPRRSPATGAARSRPRRGRC